MPTPKLSDVFAANAANFKDEAEFSRRRYDYLITRRDQIIDRLRFGSLALNGASFVALLANIKELQGSSSWLGFTRETALYSAIAFTLGIILSGASAVMDANVYRKEAGDAFVRQSDATLLVALYQNKDTPENREVLNQRMAKYHQARLVDFQHSPVAIALQNASAGCWLAGVLIPLFEALFG